MNFFNFDGSLAAGPGRYAWKFQDFVLGLQCKQWRTLLAWVSDKETLKNHIQYASFSEFSL